MLFYRYGFVHLPKEIQVLPGDAFGALLPLEEQVFFCISITDSYALVGNDNNV